METVPIEALEGRLTELTQRVEQGETVTITRDGKPVMEWKPAKLKAPAGKAKAKKAKKGLNYEALDAWKRERGYTNLVEWISPDFDDPLPEDFLLQPLPDCVDPPPEKK